MLLKAQDLLKYSTKNSQLLLRSMTFNNLANLYIQLSNLDKANSFLSDLLSLSFPGAKTNLGIAYINIASIESLQNNHEKALDHNLTGISILKESVNMTSNTINSLIIGCHNCALEYKFLGRKPEVQKYMREA